ncbi:DUF4135 domain-containing protein [Legionella erythra]|uniref:Lantibiotic biosynthesis protein dehydration domain-containing protein n=1 Tax=Legionella erythra TaxID=448 RepID=A0A0W0TUL3_LEGER|nr:DUF4135 domain-containing protein [Legionella erythra]KTC99394.1 hypothetical protein Lery_0295 [Legionella erythra]
MLNDVCFNNKNKLIENFTNDYINYISNDFYNAIHFFEKNKMLNELSKLNCLIENISINIVNYLSSIVDAYNPQRIIRLGDMHGYNKCTVLLESDNRKFIFKPIQCHFLLLINDLFILFNEFKDFDFYILKKISSDENGVLIEFIENEKIYDIHKFSYHYGAIIFLLTLLRGTDFHFENIFVVSSTPVLVDFETLFYPNILEFKNYDITATSLLKTNINSHSMMSRYHLNSKMIIKGIGSAYDVVKSNKQFITDLIYNYHSKSTRVILKPTSYYFDLLKNSMHPILLINKERRISYLETSLIGKKELSLAIMKYEIEDLLSLNIPCFYFQDGELYSSKGKIIKQEIILPSFDLVINELKNLEQFKKAITDAVISCASFENT